MKQKLFTLLTLLCFAVSGAWAADYTITLDASGMKTAPVCAGLAAITISGDGCSISSNAVQVGTGKTGTITFTRTVDNVYIKEILFTDTNHTKNGGFTFTGTSEQGTLGEYDSEAGTYTWTAKSGANLSTVSFQLQGKGGTAKMKVTQVVINDPDDTYEEIKSFTGPTEGTFGITSSKGASATISVTNPTSNGASVSSGKLSIGNNKSVIISSTENIESITFMYFQDNYKPAADKLESSPEGTYTPATFTWVPTSSTQTVTFTNKVGNTTQWVSFYVKTSPIVDTSAPVLESTTPTDGATNVDTDGDIVLTFDENVALATGYTFTLTDSEDNVIKTWDGGGVNPAATVDNETITLAYSGLTSATTYTLNINDASKITDTAATPNAMSSISLPSFTTVDGRTALTLTFTASETTLEAGGATQATSFSWTEDSGAGTKAYVSSDETVATVSSEGVITPLKAGSTTITATGTPTDLVTYKPTNTTLDIEVKAAATKWDFTSIPDSYDQYNLDAAVAASSGWTVAATSRYTPSAAFSSDATANGKTLRSLAGLRTNNAVRLDLNESVSGQSKGRLQVTDQLTLKDLTAGQKITIIYASANGSNERYVDTDDLDNMSGFDAVTSGSSATGIGYVKADGDVVLTMKPADGKTGNIINIAKITVEDYAAITPATSKSTYVTTSNLDFSEVSPSGLKAYVATSAGASGVTMTPVGAVPSKTPLLLVGTASTTYYVPVVASADAPATNKLVAGDGTTDMSGVSGFNYILYSDGLFYQVTSGTIAATKAYLHLDSAPGAHALDIIFEESGEATGITELANGQQTKANGQYFNLAGQRVNTNHKGIVIVNGKKYFNK